MTDLRGYILDKKGKYRNKDGSVTGNPVIQTRATQEAIDAFVAKCRKAGLDKSECLRQAMEQYQPVSK